MIKALEKSLGIVTDACKAVGISRVTHYQWYNTDEDYKKQVDSVGDIVLDFAENKLHERIKNNDSIATIFYLKCKGKKRGYIEKTEADVNLTGNVNLNFKPASGCDPIKD